MMKTSRRLFYLLTFITLMKQEVGFTAVSRLLKQQPAGPGWFLICPMPCFMGRRVLGMHIPQLG